MSARQKKRREPESAAEQSYALTDPHDGGDRENRLARYQHRDSRLARGGPFYWGQPSSKVSR
jgi:hypothetical protein